MKKKTVLVTGGAGYIGSHTTVELIKAGYSVVIADNFSNSDITAIHGIELIIGRNITYVEVDCSDYNALKRVFKNHEFNSVIHFAAFKAVGESVEKPLKYYRNNIGSLTTLLTLMGEFGVENIVFSSSATVYGQPLQLPATESTERQTATSPYGNTKQIGEDIISDTARASNGQISAIALRYFNPIGAHPTAFIGELPKGVPSNLVPFITQTAAGVLKCLSVYGDDYNTPDGSALRDYIDVVDLARAHVHAIGRLINKKNEAPYEFFNVGTGTPISVLELISIFEKVNNVKVAYQIVGRRAGDIEKIWADTSLANLKLGWTAQSTIEETLRNAWAWEKRVRNIE